MKQLSLFSGIVPFFLFAALCLSVAVPLGIRWLSSYFRHKERSEYLRISGRFALILLLPAVLSVLTPVLFREWPEQTVRPGLWSERLLITLLSVCTCLFLTLQDACCRIFPFRMPFWLLPVGLGTVLLLPEALILLDESADAVAWQAAGLFPLGLLFLYAVFLTGARHPQLSVPLFLVVLLDKMGLLYYLLDGHWAVLWCLLSLSSAVVLYLSGRLRTESSFLKFRVSPDEQAARRNPAFPEKFLSASFDPGSITGRLLRCFEEEKPYLKPQITIEEIAYRLHTNKTYLSKCVNMELEMNFREFVNAFRVREAMSIYVRNPMIPLSELCRLSGFKNQASFTFAFKLNTGLTPGEWCREYRQKLYGNDEKTMDVLEEPENDEYGSGEEKE